MNCLTEEQIAHMIACDACMMMFLSKTIGSIAKEIGQDNE